VPREQSESDLVGDLAGEGDFVALPVVRPSDMLEAEQTPVPSRDADST
jgi:hypothetical protein